MIDENAFDNLSAFPECRAAFRKLAEAFVSLSESHRLLREEVALLKQGLSHQAPCAGDKTPRPRKKSAVDDELASIWAGRAEA